VILIVGMAEDASDRVWRSAVRAGSL